MVSWLKTRIWWQAGMTEENCYVMGVESRASSRWELRRFLQAMSWVTHLLDKDWIPDIIFSYIFISKLVQLCKSWVRDPITPKIPTMNAWSFGEMSWNKPKHSTPDPQKTHADDFMLYESIPSLSICKVQF